MDEKELGSIRGWFAGRLPDGWFTATDVMVEDDQIVVVGTLPDADLPGTTPEEREGAAAGRIARFREETRGHRIVIAREAEERFRRYVTWGARLADVTKRFTPGGSAGPRHGGWGRRHGWRRAGWTPAPHSDVQVF
jgi:hypothetical protein